MHLQSLGHTLNWFRISEIIYQFDCHIDIYTIYYTPAPRRGWGVYCFTSVRPSFQNIFRHIFLSNYWWPKCDIWSQASYKCPISWEAFLDLSHSYFLFADLVGFYTHWTYMHLVLSVIFGHFSLIPMRDFVSIKEQCTEESVLSIMSTVSQHTY